jgi:SAM-dependent methyltransferase
MSDGTSMQTAEVSEEQRRIDALGPWFSIYDFGGGLKTASLRGDIKSYFDRRVERVLTPLRRYCDPATSTVLDMGCADGMFSIAAAKAGYQRVLGVDVRPEHIARARYASERFGLNSVTFETANIYDIERLGLEPFNAVIFQGLLYHLADPVLALRKAAALAKTLIFVGTWTDAHLDGNYYRIQREDPTDFIQGDTTISMVPSRQGLHASLFFLGFESTLEFDLSSDVDSKWGASATEWREVVGLRAGARARDVPAPATVHNDKIVLSEYRSLESVPPAQRERSLQRRSILTAVRRRLLGRQ